MNLFNRLKTDCLIEWEKYVKHRFVESLGNGSLKKESFQNYLRQDYLFLIHYARAFSLAGAKSTTVFDLRHAEAGLSAIINTEINLHVSYCKHWDISKKNLETCDESFECLAYSRFILDKGFHGNLLDLYVALSPCMSGYAEIGMALETAKKGNPFESWIDMYASDAFQIAALNDRKYIDDLASRETISDPRYLELKSTFKYACKLEANFWSSFL